MYAVPLPIFANINLCDSWHLLAGVVCLFLTWHDLGFPFSCITTFSMYLSSSTALYFSILLLSHNLPSIFHLGGFHFFFINGTVLPLGKLLWSPLCYWLYSSKWNRPSKSDNDDVTARYICSTNVCSRNASGGTLLRHLLNTIEMHFPNKVKILNTLFCFVTSNMTSRTKRRNNHL